jgi:DNA-directed RNA polymerase subunit RPC12/RpoP
VQLVHGKITCGATMAYPIKTCAVCGEEFELKPGKPGFANRCPECSEEETAASPKSSDVLKTDKQANAARREAMRNLLYRKDS